MLDLVVGAGAALLVAGGANPRSADKLDSGWPPVLVFAVLVIAAVAIAAVIVMVRRTQATIRARSASKSTAAQENSRGRRP